MTQVTSVALDPGMERFVQDLTRYGAAYQAFYDFLDLMERNLEQEEVCGVPYTSPCGLLGVLRKGENGPIMGVRFLQITSFLTSHAVSLDEVKSGAELVLIYRALFEKRVQYLFRERWWQVVDMTAQAHHLYQEIAAFFHAKPDAAEIPQVVREHWLEELRNRSTIH